MIVQARKVSRSVDRQISVLLCSANEIRRVFAPWCVWRSACAGAALQQRRAEKHRKEPDSAEQGMGPRAFYFRIKGNFSLSQKFSLTFSLKIDKNMENEARIQQKWENGSPGEQK